MRSITLIAAIIIGGIPAMSFAASQQLTLAANAKTSYKIVIADKASPSEEHAAAELQSFLKQISGAQLPIVRESAKPKAPRILLGRSKMLPSKLDSTIAALGSEGFYIGTKDKDLIIAGGRLRGTMYGAYAFLEEVLGCRWYSSKVSRIPKMSTVKIGPLNITQKPAFEYREPFYTDAFDADWAARNRTNSSNARLDEARGGNVSFGKDAFVHTFYKLVPPSVYFKDHPEYFSLINGKRIDSAGQLCLTNPDVLKITIAKVLEWIKDDPGATLYSVSQNDCGNPCQCEKCKAIVAEEGSESGPLIRFVNAVAAEVGKQYPDKLIETLAYQYTKDPPTKTAPAANVRIRLCPIENCVAHPFEQCKNSAHFLEILKGWNKITNNLYIWHYNANFGHYLQPFPNWDELKADVGLYKRSGAKGLFMQGNYSEGGGGEFDELRAYVIAKQLWNPNVDFWATVDDFLGGYYGKAGPVLRKYIDFVESKVRGKDVHFGIYTGPESAVFQSDYLDQANAYFDEAEKAVAADAPALERVKHARMAVKYVDIMYKYWWKGKAEVNEADVKQFCDECKSWGITNISEGWSVAVFMDKMLKK